MPNTLAKTLREFAESVDVGAPYDLPDWIKLTQIAETIHPRLYTVPMEWLRLHAAMVAEALTHHSDLHVRNYRSDVVSDVASGIVDDDAPSLVTWVGLGPWTLELMDDASELLADDADAYERVRAGQRLALERIAYAILELCEARAEDVETGE